MLLGYCVGNCDWWLLLFENCGGGYVGKNCGGGGYEVKNCGCGAGGGGTFIPEKDALGPLLKTPGIDFQSGICPKCGGGYICLKFGGGTDMSGSGGPEIVRRYKVF